jgi:hypothetical protein
VLGEELLVVEHSGGVGGEGHPVDGARRARAQVPDDVHVRRVDVLERGGAGEVREDPGGGELTERRVGVEGQDVGHVLLDQAGAQGRLGVRDVVHDHAHVRVLGLELPGEVLEVGDGLGLELEEGDRGGRVRVRGAAAQQQGAHGRRGPSPRAPAPWRGHGRTGAGRADGGGGAGVSLMVLLGRGDDGRQAVRHCADYKYVT